GSTIHCSRPAGRGAGASWTLSLPYTAASDVAAGDVASAASVVSDENPLGLSASDTTTVLTSADLGLSVDDGLASVIAGTGGHAYTLTVTNAGPSDAGGVSLTASWPAGFSQGSLTPCQGSCEPVGGGPDFTCSLGSPAAGGSASVPVTYGVPARTPTWAPPPRAAARQHLPH